jgi:hypothetical protein
VVDPGIVGHVWTTDGTAAGTRELTPADSSVGSAVVIGNTLFFASGNDLWSFDGTREGTRLVRQLERAP